jgi:hypothetical protein
LTEATAEDRFIQCFTQCACQLPQEMVIVVHGAKVC